MHAIKRVCLTGGVPQGERPPLEKNPQTLLHRACPTKEGFPLGRVSGQTRTQLTQSTPTQILLRPQLTVLQIYQMEERGGGVAAASSAG